MHLRRYEVRSAVQIDAPIDEVFSIASDPKMVPFYAAEVNRIEIVERLSDHDVLVKRYLKFAGFTWGSLYRFHYRRPTHYGGVQQGRGMLRGYFNLTFESQDGGTIVSHTEGVLSPVPFLARAAGFIYFHVLSRDGIREELLKLKHLVENKRVVIALR